jgi:hypothetical protein
MKKYLPIHCEYRICCSVVARGRNNDYCFFLPRVDFMKKFISLLKPSPEE